MTDQRMQKTAKTLVENGFQVTMVGRKLSTSKDFFADNYSFKRLNCFFTKGKLFYIAYNIRLFFYLLSQKFDAIIAVDLDTIAPAFCAAKIKGAKKIYDAHEYFTEVPEVYNRKTVKNIWEKVAAIFIPKADLAYTVSQSLAAIFKEKYSIAFQTIRNVPFANDEKTIAENSNPRFILYQGAVNEGRGLEAFLDAIIDLPILFKIAGNGDVLENLKAQVTKNKQQQQVEFLGAISPTGLKTITQQAFIGINLLENKGQSYYYSLANKFFDYAQADVPQICIAFPEYQMLNKSYNIAVLVENLQKDTIKSAVIRLVEDRELYENLKSNCKKCAAENNWELESKKLVHSIKKLWNE